MSNLSFSIHLIDLCLAQVFNLENFLNLFIIWLEIKKVQEVISFRSWIPGVSLILFNWLIIQLFQYLICFLNYFVCLAEQCFHWKVNRLFFTIFMYLAYLLKLISIWRKSFLFSLLIRILIIEYGIIYLYFLTKFIHGML